MLPLLFISHVQGIFTAYLAAAESHFCRMTDNLCFSLELLDPPCCVSGEECYAPCLGNESMTQHYSWIHWKCYKREKKGI